MPSAESRLEFGSLLTELNGRLGLNGLQNIICMDKEFHNHFATAHHYKVMVPRNVSYEKLKIKTNYVTFGISHQATYSVSSPQYLKVHALCCMLAEQLGIKGA